MDVESISTFTFEFLEYIRSSLEVLLVNVIVITALARKALKSVRKMKNSFANKKKRLLCNFVATEKPTLKTCLVA